MTSRHPWSHEPRKRLTDQQRARIFLDRGGKCHRCDRKLRSGDRWQLDHIIALEVGGKDEADNLAPCCDWCHKGKTAEDHKKAAKGRAVATACIIPTSQRQKRHRLRKPKGMTYNWGKRRYERDNGDNGDFINALPYFRKD